MGEIIYIGLVFYISVNSNPGGYIKRTLTSGIQFILTFFKERGCEEWKCIKQQLFSALPLSSTNIFPLYSNPERQLLLSLLSPVVRPIGARQTQNSSINHNGPDT
jgi:hypothetical protein